jgi:hypothetical protein
VRWDFPTLEALGTRSVELVVQVEITATGIITNADYGVHSDQVALVRGIPVSTHVARLLYYLPLALKNP